MKERKRGRRERMEDGKKKKPNISSSQWYELDRKLRQEKLKRLGTLEIAGRIGADSNMFWHSAASTAARESPNDNSHSHQKTECARRVPLGVGGTLALVSGFRSGSKSGYVRNNRRTRPELVQSTIVKFMCDGVTLI